MSTDEEENVPVENNFVLLQDQMEGKSSFALADDNLPNPRELEVNTSICNDRANSNSLPGLTGENES